MDLKLEKIHRVLEFDQSLWLKEYIDLNTEMWKGATSSFERDFMNNAVIGKTMENIRKRIDVRFCSDVGKVEKLVAKPTLRTGPSSL